MFLCFPQRQWLSVSCLFSCVAQHFVFLSFLGFVERLGTDTMTTKHAEWKTVHGEVKDFQRLKSLTTSTSKIKVPPIISILFFFLWVAKNISQVSQADRLTAIPSLHCAECVAGIQNFFFFFPWHALYCSILASSNTGRHLSIEMNQPGESPLAQRIMQQVTGAMFRLFSAVRITQTLAHTGTIIC